MFCVLRERPEDWGTPSQFERIKEEFRASNVLMMCQVPESTIVRLESPRQGNASEVDARKSDYLREPFPEESDPEIMEVEAPTKKKQASTTKKGCVLWNYKYLSTKLLNQMAHQLRRIAPQAVIN